MKLTKSINTTSTILLHNHHNHWTIWDHVKEERISITINGKQYIASNLEQANIRFHVNGCYLQHYIQTRKKWRDKYENDTIDFNVLTQLQKQLSVSEKQWLIKLLHDQVPLGTR